jgi:hypothetical protein
MSSYLPSEEKDGLLSVQTQECVELREATKRFFLAVYCDDPGPWVVTHFKKSY